MENYTDVLFVKVHILHTTYGCTACSHQIIVVFHRQHCM